ncbi:MAG: RICIN domain-containing protein [Thermoleophilaceae bacterium]|nr:RICIN domain-containing protein [Thermoleophilaceae bacterium]
MIPVAVAGAENRTLDGSGNNIAHPDWGQAGTPYRRIGGANYADGISTQLAGPEPRYVSNRIYNDIAQNIFSERQVTAWGNMWGQFTDHVFGLAKGGGETSHIAFNAADALEQFENDLGIIPFGRDAAAPGSGCVGCVITDASQIQRLAYYEIVARHSGKALQVRGASTASGTQVDQSTYTGGLHQQFRFGDAGNGYVVIVPRNSSTKSLGTKYNNPANGQPVVSQTYTGAIGQMYKLVSTGDGYFKLVGRVSNRNIDIKDGSTANGAPAIMWDNNDGANQQFQLIATYNPRQSINTVSSYIDAQNVYGVTNDRLEWLRDGPVNGNMADNGAELLMPGGYLPRKTARGDASSAPEMAIMGHLMPDPDKATVAGDVRANENIGLTSIQTLLAREHNRVVGLLPNFLSAENKFQIARKVVGAEEQYITYTQFLPNLGVTLSSYGGYKPATNATLSAEFATVLYRAHSMIHGELEQEVETADYTAAELADLEDSGVEVTTDGPDTTFAVPLNIAFGNPDLVEKIGLGPILAGMAGESQYRNDEMMDNQLRSVLFGIPKPGVPDPSVCLDGPTLPDCFNGVVDLGAIDLQRGRDHGMPSYNEMRKAYGLPVKTTFMSVTGESTESFPTSDPLVSTSDPINDPDILGFVSCKDVLGAPVAPGDPAAVPTSCIRRTTLAARLKAIYGNVSQMDAFTGMMAEKHITGSDFGELQRAGWKKEFETLRDGDRFFYQNDPGLTTIKILYGIDFKRSLKQLIVDNTGIDGAGLQDNVFKLP